MLLQIKMNYTINYPQSVGHAQMNTPMSVNSNQGQRAIVLTPNSQGTGNINGGGVNNQQTLPMVMQMGLCNTPVFYTYPNNEGIVNKVHDNSSSSSGLGQVMLAPVSPVTHTPQGINIVKNNGNSPTMPAININTDNKSGAARSLGEMFNV